MRSRNVDGVPDDADAKEGEPVLVLDLTESSERRGSGSGGTSGDKDDGGGAPQREDSMFAIERSARIEDVGAVVRVVRVKVRVRRGSR